MPATDVDVVVVGAGYAGITAARDLCDRGLSVLVLEASEDLGGSVALLGRSLAIVADDLVDDRAERSEHGGRWRLGACVGSGLG